MSNNISKSNIIYLFGAGASLPAKLPNIREMTKEFFTNHILNDSAYKSIKSKIMILKDITAKEFENQIDLESFMTLTIDLQKDRMRKLLDNKYPELSEIDNPELDKIKIIVQNFIRQKLEALDAKSVEYLRPLLGLSNYDKTLTIFTLNYDATIEILCENYDISYSDGFTPFWNPKDFSNDISVKIYKVHGSLGLELNQGSL